MVAHLLSISIFIAVATFAILRYSFFSWHPIFMALGYALLMSEGILIFSKQSSLVSGQKPSQKLFYHWCLLVGALVSALLGFGVIYWNKMAHNKPHFVSWHGIFGLVTVLYTCIQVPAGALAKYAPNLHIPKVALLRLVHGLSGTFLATLGLATIMLGLFSGFVGDAIYFRGLVGVGVLLLAGVLIGQSYQLVLAKQHLFMPAKVHPTAAN